MRRRKQGREHDEVARITCRRTTCADVSKDVNMMKLHGSPVRGPESADVSKNVNMIHVAMIDTLIATGIEGTLKAH